MDIIKRDENLPRWIYHFEKQAKIGVSVRSSFNNRIVVVSKLKKKENLENNFSDNKVDRKKKIPDIVSPIQQTVEQAEEEIRREQEEEDNQQQDSSDFNKNRKYNNKRKILYKGRIKSKKFKDIFS